jgi:hypothetical protein
VARLHDARHTAATLLLVQGVDQRVVMSIIGWSTATMANRYQHAVSELLQLAAARMGDALWGQLQPAGPDSHVSGGQERGGTADLPLFRRNSVAARCRLLWPDMPSSCTDRRTESPGVAWRLSLLAPYLAPGSGAILTGDLTGYIFVTCPPAPRRDCALLQYQRPGLSSCIYSPHQALSQTDLR